MRAELRKVDGDGFEPSAHVRYCDRVSGGEAESLKVGIYPERSGIRSVPITRGDCRRFRWRRAIPSVVQLYHFLNGAPMVLQLLSDNPLETVATYRYPPDRRLDR